MFRRGNPWIYVAALVLSFGTTAYLLWLRPLLWRAANPIDPAPPAWGSTSAYSTPEGFLLGKWVAHFDTSSARSQDSIARFVMSRATFSLTFSSGSEFIWSNGRRTVNGKWTMGGKGIQFTPERVDEIPAAVAFNWLVLQRFRQRRSWSFNRLRLEQGQAIELVKTLGPIQIAPNQKQLVSVGNINASGKTFLGTLFWDRARR